MKRRYQAVFAFEYSNSIEMGFSPASKKNQTSNPALAKT